jgi:hypothetical protein
MHALKGIIRQRLKRPPIDKSRRGLQLFPDGRTDDLEAPHKMPTTIQKNTHLKLSRRRKYSLSLSKYSLRMQSTVPHSQSWFISL